MLAKESLQLAKAKAGFGKITRVRDMLRSLFKPRYAGKQVILPSREVRDAIRDKEETVREICEMLRWSISHR